MGAAAYAAHVLERLQEFEEVKLVGAVEEPRSDALLNLDGHFRAGHGQPVITTVLDLGPLFAPRVYGARERLGLRWRVASAARRSHHVLAPSTAVQTGLEQYLRLPPSRVTVLPPLPAAHFHRAARADVEDLRSRLQLPARYFLFLGSRSPRKNLALLAEAWKRARIEDVGLVLAGPGDEGITDALDVGYVPNEQLAALLSGALGWLNPSLYEGSAIGALEAMACGTAVLAAATGAQAHAVGLNGLLLPTNNPDEWARALKAVSTDPTLRARLSAAGLRKVRELTGSPPGVRPLVMALAGARDQA